jgi:hypothetical protein
MYNATQNGDPILIPTPSSSPNDPLVSFERPGQLRVPLHVC